MKAKRSVNRVLALFVAMLMVLTLLPAVAFAAPSTGIDYSTKGGSPTKPVNTEVGAAKPGYIAAKATGEDLTTDRVTITIANEEIATVVDQNKTDTSGYWKFDIVGHKAGSTTATVTANDNPENTEQVQVNVTAAADTYIDFFAGFPSMATAVGASKPGLIAARAVGEGIVEGENDKVTCVSEDETIATVDDQNTTNSKGYWKFDVIGKKKGETNIIVTADANPDIQQIVSVSVVDDLVTVINGDTTKAFKVGEFKALPKTTIEKWAGRNHAFSFKTHEDGQGVALATVLAEAGVNVDELADDQLIQFTPSDGTTYQGTFTVKEILRDKRYYFKNSAGVTEGAKATAAQLAEAVEVPTILCYLDNNDGRLAFGQVAPNERSESVSIKCMTTGGVIKILDERAKKMVCDVKADKASGSTIEPGTQITLSSATILTTDIYYTTDGTNPTRENAAVYNYRTKEMSDEPDGGLKNATIKAPSTEGTFTLKVMQASYGSLNSDVVTFTYTVKKPVQKGATYSVSGQSVKVTKAATATANGAVTFTKAKNAKSVVVPKTVKLADGKVYNVTTVGAKAFTGKKIRKVTVGANVSKLAKYALKGSKATKLVVKTKKLKKASVKGSLKGSKVKTVQVKVGKKKTNRTYIKKYKKIFTKKNAGKKVAVK